MDANHSDPLKHRKGLKKLTFVEKDGTLAKNQEVFVKQVKHQFLFGCSEFSAIPLANDELQGADKEWAEERLRLFFEIFNYATLPFY